MFHRKAEEAKNLQKPKNRIQNPEPSERHPSVENGITWTQGGESGKRLSAGFPPEDVSSIFSHVLQWGSCSECDASASYLNLRPPAFPPTNKRAHTSTDSPSAHSYPLTRHLPHSPPFWTRGSREGPPAPPPLPANSGIPERWGGDVCPLRGVQFNNPEEKTGK